MSYVDEVIDLIVKENPDEPEFHQAVKEVLESFFKSCYRRKRRTIQKRCTLRKIS